MPAYIEMVGRGTWLNIVYSYTVPPRYLEPAIPSSSLSANKQADGID